MRSSRCSLAATASMALENREMFLTGAMTALGRLLTHVDVLSILASIDCLAVFSRCLSPLSNSGLLLPQPASMAASASSPPVFSRYAFTCSNFAG